MGRRILTIIVTTIIVIVTIVSYANNDTDKIVDDDTSALDQISSQDINITTEKTKITEEKSIEEKTAEAEIKPKETLVLTKQVTKPNLPREYEESFRTHFPEFGEAVIAGDCSTVEPEYKTGCEFYLSLYSRELMPLITPDDISELFEFFPEIANGLVTQKKSCELIVNEVSQIPYYKEEIKNEPAFVQYLTYFCYETSAIVNADITICSQLSNESEELRIIDCEDTVREQAGYFFGPEHPVFMGIYDEYL